MSNTLKLGTDGKWAAKEGSLLAFNDENDNYKPLPFTFDRSTSATRVNKEGLIEVVSNNEPRIDFLNDSKGALLLEPNRSNLITYSEDLTASGWDNVAYPVTITSNSIISPDGTLNATLITPTSGNSRHSIRNLSTSAVSGTTYMLSAFVKKGGSRYIVFGDAGDNLWRVVTFDLNNGVVTDEYNSNGTITSYGNGWYRITCKITRTNAGTVQFSLGASETDTNVSIPSFDNTSLTVYTYGCQIESNSSYATSYIPTQGSAVTRLADVCNNAGNDQVINSTEGVLYFEGSALANDGTNRFISLTNGVTDATNISLAFTTTTNQIRALVDTSYSLQVSLTHTVSSVLDFNKVAFLYKQNDFKLYINGVLVGTDTSGNVPSANYFNNLSFIRISALTFYGNVKDVKIYNTALTDQELINLTRI